MINMKRFIVGFVSVLISTYVLGQYDQKALSILDAMSDKYQKVQSFKAGFTYTLENKMENINEEFSGEIAVKGEKFALKMSEQEIYNDGETIWTYMSDVNEVNIDYYLPEEGDLTPSSIYKAYKKGFKYLYLEENIEKGQTVDVVDLVPEDTNNQFYKVRMFIDKNNRTLKKWTMFDKTGNIYTYVITNFDESFAAGDNYFVFDVTKYPGVEEIDLR